MLARPVIEPGPHAPKSGTQPIEPTSRQLILEEAASLVVVSLPITGGPLPSIGPNKYPFPLMLCFHEPAESLLRVYERRKQQQQRL